MATHDYNLANQDGASFRSDLNNALSAIVSNNSSSTAPATTFAHQIWVDTTANVIKQRNAANDAWVELWRIDGGFNAKTFNSNVTLNAQSDLRFADSDSSNWVAFQAPATVSSNVTWTLPSADGSSGDALTTNGSGTLSWSSASADAITEGNTSAEVVDTGSDGHFKVVTEGTEALRVDAGRKLLYGTTATRAVGTFGAGQAIHIESTDGGNWPGLNITWNRSNDTFGPRINFGRSHGSALNSSTVVQNGDELGGIYFYGADGTDLVSGGALIKAEVDGTPGSNDMPGRLVFSTTADGASTPTERMRITNAGNVGIGLSNPGAPLEIQANSGAEALYLRAASIGVGQLLFRNNAGNATWFRISAESNNTQLNAFGSSYISFFTNSSERMRVESSGSVFVNRTSASSANEKFSVLQTISGTAACFQNSSTSNTSDIVILRSNRNDGSGGRILTYYNDAASAYRFWMIENGNLQNTNGTYGTLSDVKLKENIVDANSQWDDIKAIRIRNWNFKEETGHDTHRQIGPVAQELEQVCPGLVYEVSDRDADGTDLGTTTKGVSQSVLYMKAVKALQEAMERIETLEAKVAALEAA